MRSRIRMSRRQSVVDRIDFEGRNSGMQSAPLKDPRVTFTGDVPQDMKDYVMGVLNSYDVPADTRNKLSVGVDTKGHYHLRISNIGTREINVGNAESAEGYIGTSYSALYRTKRPAELKVRSRK